MLLVHILATSKEITRHRRWRKRSSCKSWCVILALLVLLLVFSSYLNKSVAAESSVDHRFERTSLVDSQGDRLGLRNFDMSSATAIYRSCQQIYQTHGKMLGLLDIDLKGSCLLNIQRTWLLFHIMKFLRHVGMLADVCDGWFWKETFWNYLPTCLYYFFPPSKQCVLFWEKRHWPFSWFPALSDEVCAWRWWSWEPVCSKLNTLSMALMRMVMVMKRSDLVGMGHLFGGQTETLLVTTVLVSTIPSTYRFLIFLGGYTHFNLQPHCWIVKWKECWGKCLKFIGRMSQIFGIITAWLIRCCALRTRRCLTDSWSFAALQLPRINPHHFALNFDYYTHFTSPIRRYPDVMVHRILCSLLDRQMEAKEGEEGEEICYFQTRDEAKDEVSWLHLFH